MTNIAPFRVPKNAVIVKSTIPIKILCHTKAATVTPRMLVESAVDGNADDMYEIIFAGNETKLARGWVMYDIANKRTLSANNATVSKSTTFAIADGVWVGSKIPVVEAIIAVELGTLNPGQRMVAAGSGTIKDHPDDLAPAANAALTQISSAFTGIALDPTVAILLNYVTTSDGTQVVQVIPLW